MKIYLSYVMTDRFWAEQLASLLRAEGFEVSSSGEKDAPYDKESEETYRQDFQSADFLVPVFTESSLRRPWVLFELGVAMGADKPTVPVLVTQEGKTPRIPFQTTFHSLIRAEFPREAATQLQQLIPELTARA